VKTDVLIRPLALLMSAGLALTVACTRHDAGVPSALAGRRLASVATGEPAEREIARLHGRPIAAAEHLIATYGDPPTITLYVSRYTSDDAARADLLDMSTAMAGGVGPFAPLEFDGSGGGVRFRTTGLGLAHLFYRAGRAVVWLQAPAADLDPAAADLAAHDEDLLAGG
jgi:hypothetical protein